jgi:acyl carrier protein
MTNQDLLKLVKSALIQVDDELADLANTITIDSTLSELGIDSVIAIELAANLEETLSIQLADDDLAALSSVRGLIELLQQARVGTSKGVGDDGNARIS